MRRLLGFLHRGGLGQWSYAIAADVAAQGEDFVRFMSQDVDLASGTILGQVWENNTWTPRRTRFPDVVRNFERRDFDEAHGDHILRYVPYTLGRLVTKDDQIDLLLRTPSVATLVPVTYPLTKDCDVIGNVRRWGAAILKPSRGRLGHGIIFLRADDSHFDLEERGVWKRLDQAGLQAELARLHAPGARDYVIQQFAAGTGPDGRFYNVRIVVQKSGDGDWHVCPEPMSLLARTGTVVANREHGAHNIALRPLLERRFKEQAASVLEDVFAQCVHIARLLDDAVDASAEELALDLGLDNKGHTWFHEANWRGGMWLFDEDVGFCRHGGMNMARLARLHQPGGDVDAALACRIAASNRPRMAAPRVFPEMTLSGNIRVGLEIPRRGDETAALAAQAHCLGLSVLAVSSSASFRAVQRRVGKGLGVLVDQLPAARRPLILSRGGWCRHDPLDARSPKNWLQEELLETGLISIDDLHNGASMSPSFLRRCIAENRQDLGLECLDAFLVEGLERSLARAPDQRQAWRHAAWTMTEAIHQGHVRAWGFVLTEYALQQSWGNPELLVEWSRSADNEPGGGRDDLENQGAHQDGIPPAMVLLHLQSPVLTHQVRQTAQQIAQLPLRLAIALPEPPIRTKPWHQSHPSVTRDLLPAVLEIAPPGSLILIPAVRLADLQEALAILRLRTADERNASQPAAGDPGPTLDAAPLGPKIQPSTRATKVDPNLKASGLPGSVDSTPTAWFASSLPGPARLTNRALHALARFDHRQYFRFFIDGRFHQKYRGWRGYEANEQNSVQGMLNAFCHILDNMDISGGLRSTYIRELHTLCMKNVVTKNPKSMPGDLRYLEAGFNFYASTTTPEHLQEILEMRRGDGTVIFHTESYQRIANDFSVESILQGLSQIKRLRYRPWYPNLSPEEQAALNGKGSLDDFFRVKHAVQREYAQRVDQLVERYNTEIAKAASRRARLLAISRLGRELEMLHPFPDGNGRTLISLLTNHLLLYNDFLPTILWDPNWDLELSVAQFADEIERGMAVTEELLTDPHRKVFDYAITEARHAENQAFQNMSWGLITRLAPHVQPPGLRNLLHQEPHADVFLYLTPQRLADVTNGNWLNVAPEDLTELRYLKVEIDPTQPDGDLLFCRDITELSMSGDPVTAMRRLAESGVRTIVLNDVALARQAPMPALFVPDVDDALHAVARAARIGVGCKSVAVVGVLGKSTAKAWLEKILRAQAQVHAMDSSPNTTPQVMRSLANLRLTDNVEINEAAIRARPGVTRHRISAVDPNICLITAFEQAMPETLLESYAAVADAMPDGGLCLVNNVNNTAARLIAAMRARNRSVAIQSFGAGETDHARLLSTTWDEKTSEWRIQAEILGTKISYVLNDKRDFLPVLSVGLLAVVTNLGFDIRQAAGEFSRKQ